MSLLYKFLIPIVVIIIGFVITEGKIPKIFNIFTDESRHNNSANSVATSTIDISDILSKNDSLETLFEKQSFLERYIGKEIQGTGSYVDFFKSSGTFRVIINISSNNIICALGEGGEIIDLEQKLRVLKKGQNIVFSGIFTNIFLNGIYREIDDCKWIR